MVHWTQDFFVDDAELFVNELRRLNETGEEEVTELLALLSNDFDISPETVLDVGCGIGRHALPFAAAGRDVIGIDISPDYLAEARQRAADADVSEQTDFRELDMRNLESLDTEFDLVVCLLSAFGYFDDETNVDILRSMRRLANGGACVVEVMNKDALLTDFQSTKIREFDFGVIVERHEFDSRTSQRTIRRDVLRGEPPDLTYEGRTNYQVRVYSPPELERRFYDVGFDEVDVFKTYAGEEPSHEYNRFMVVGRQ